ncbi:MAG: molybdate ABC transporter substrate-binding protein [Caulobacter sp.]|nr:molybdate ABC transporter substrate-binding protein [Caulobacter sp.]
MRDRRAFLVGAASLAAQACAPTGPGLTVFAAASLQEALTAAGGAWTADGRAPATLSFGASSAMARQIAEGAPADVFISADEDWMDWLAGRGRIVAASRRDLLSNQLVLIAPASASVALTIGPDMPLGQALGDGRLAMADPDAVPAGRYARAALTRLKVWPQVAGRLLPAENVRAALAYVARGEAPLGVVYATDALAEPAVRVVGRFPAWTHPPIVYPGAVVTGARDPAAGAFLNFLGGPRAMAVFRRYGFSAVAGG